MDSAVVSAAVTVAACAAGCATRVLMARITTGALVRTARIEEEARTARINALAEGGTLQERDHRGRQLAVRQGAVTRGKHRGPHGG
ncbi:hypothetical protein M2164_008473 [Streptomyces sp. SAI-208]|uniref:hypothetical protein n=1 Tax=unclassified Streptomyces TaxID=2593676 RepID=UPI002473AA9E|nr:MULTISPECIES: hypothetical protein [unclassified Streptomyces]MDH6554072.1 hypothetical protein [Streptomyces sp. SAI-041]MDH6573149.1 hypothetical protein [Streptomyces sp. SAI-117]MDH6581862.1 hypothetical protein [Streptomyces sp. SAI-133]MDH6612838.1 hypothetical protein [Streptomyces sp. SAI-208]